MSFISSGKTILHLTDDAVFAYKVNGGNVHRLDVYPWQDDDFEQALLACIVNDANGSPVTILNDAVDQHYRKERVPSIGIVDSVSVVKRKLAIAFPQYPFRAYKKLLPTDAQKKSQSGERSIKTATYLFAAAPETQNIQRILSVLKESGVFISGFGLLPTESVSLVDALSSKIFNTSSKSLSPLAAFKDTKRSEKDTVWTIFIGQNRSGGLRQIVTKDGELALTRITPIVDADSDGELWSQDVAREYQATMTYLSRFGYTADDTLNIIVISDVPSQQKVEQVLQTAKGKIHTITLQEASKLLKISPDIESENHIADDLHVAWIAKKLKLAMALSGTQLDSIAKPRQYAGLATMALVLLFAGAVYYSAQTYLHYYKMNKNLVQAQAELDQVTNTYEAELSRKEDLGISIRLVQASFQINSELENQKIDVYDTLKKIRLGLNGSIQLEGMKYEYSEVEPKIDPSVGFVQPGTTVPEKKLTLSMAFPGDFDIAEGNAIVESLSNRFAAIFPDSEIDVTKVLKDVSYRGEITSETGVNAVEQLAPPLSGEIQIKIDAKKVNKVAG